MDPSGLQAVSSINALSKPQTGLRLFQQVTAQILDVQGTTAVLSIEGIPIVAQLTSPGQAAMLLSRQSARFMVAQLTNQRLTLKLIGEALPEGMSDSAASSREELAARVLEQNNIPITPDNLTMARAVLKQHLPITAGLLTELSEALGKSGSIDAAKANLAAALKASNLPVTSQSIELASRQPAEIGDSISYISKMVANLANQDVSDEILNDLKLVLQQLGGYVPDADTDALKRGEQLKAILEALGKSLENMLLSQSQGWEVPQPETGLLSLSRLQQALKLAGKNGVADAIGEFLEDLRAAQFLNARSEWLEINFAIQNIKADQDFSSARLRILRDDKTHSGTMAPASTRLILQVDINDDETVEANLSIIGKQIRAAMTAADSDWCQEAEHELPSLGQALANLGFTLKDATVSVGEPSPPNRLKVATDETPMMAVDIEI